MSRAAFLSVIFSVLCAWGTAWPRDGAATAQPDKEISLGRAALLRVLCSGHSSGARTLLPSSRSSKGNSIPSTSCHHCVPEGHL